MKRWILTFVNNETREVRGESLRVDASQGLLFLQERRGETAETFVMANLLSWKVSP